MIYNSILEKIGDTPLVKINRLNDSSSTVLAKVEYFNPAGSVKDRISYAMIKDALDSGKINKDTTLIEPTSGNTGVALAMVASVLGLKLIIVMPENMSDERKKLIQGYGAKLILTDKALGAKGSVVKAEELNKEIENSVILQQFENPSNPKNHYENTAKEILKETHVDIFVAGIGTGGTVSGVGKYLKQQNPDAKVYGVEPLSSNILNGGNPGPHIIQGIGANFVPENLDKSIVDAFIDVSNEDALETAKRLMKEEGLAVGISSGAAMYAALQLAKENKGKTIVVVLPDTASRYLSTSLFD